MTTRVEITFTVEGAFDGPLDPAVADMTTDEMANLFARDFKQLILSEAASGDPDIDTRVNVRASVRLHDDERSGHAEA